MNNDWSQQLAAAQEAAHAAASVIMAHYQANVAVTVKADRTPVTVADVEAEQAIKRVLLAAYPDYGFFGEETGTQDADRDAVWLVDPIDGTRSFVREYPFFSTQIALRVHGELVVGVSSAPAFAEVAWASVGGGAFLNGQRIAVSDIATWADAALSTGNLGSMPGWQRRWAALGELIQAVARNRGYGDFYHYHLLASGKIDALVESDLNILDVAALTVIVREAGGLITDIDGRAIDLETTSVVAANARLHADLLSRFTLR
ncbi:MAG: inositol monophosphatase family protein [Pseudomonadota bacterium]